MVGAPRIDLNPEDPGPLRNPFLLLPAPLLPAAHRPYCLVTLSPVIWFYSDVRPYFPLLDPAAMGPGFRATS